MRVYDADDHGHVIVREDGVERDLDPRYDLRNHSPDGFAWGYEGSGPAQLALAIVCDLTGDDVLAQQIYQRFKSLFVAKLNMDEGWTVSEEELRPLLQRCEA